MQRFPTKFKFKCFFKGGSSSRVVLGAAKLRENKRKQKIPGSPPGPGKLKKKNKRGPGFNPMELFRSPALGKKG